ncbi:hypothetical protein PAF17_16050 [Paracoccus sp. Z330]|uniref:Tip attachment protein J domain-containing protein n=1 Tax=Paracoccus onchidii TaxID=3017813 RepID=A0ABT4ZI22_9RHOB|nr:hypothetical protein [Paracoccus onchidii]MDB6179005.1 hypothetical protein [Paracoccus onchidii]
MNAAIDPKLKSRIEEVLGLRGRKDNHAVRFKDLSKIVTATNSAEVSKIAERVAREIAEGYDNANVDLSQLEADIDAAMQQAAAAAAAAANAQSTANNANAYSDQVSQQVRDDLAVEFAAAQQAAAQALEHADEAEQWAISSEANVTRLFPSDFGDEGRFWTSDRSARPENPAVQPDDSEFLQEAIVGDFIRLHDIADDNQFVVSRGVTEFIPGNTLRITVVTRHLGQTSSKLRTVLCGLRSDYSFRRSTGSRNVMPTAPDEWQTVVAEVEVPEKLGGEVWLRAGVYTASGATPDSTIDVAMIRIEDVTALKAAEGSAAAAEIARSDAVVASGNAQGAASAAATSQSLAADSAAQSATEAGVAEGARQQAENSASAAADSATTASSAATTAGSSAYAADQSRIAAEAARDGADDARSSAEIARDDAVLARQDSEDAAAAAQTSLELTAEVSGRDMSVINDTFLISSDWSRWSSQGDLTQLENSVYPIGRDWRFQVTDTQSDGLQIDSSADSTWLGQVNADAYAVEVEFTLSSGSLDGAAIGVNWTTTQGGFHPDRKLLKDIVSGPAYIGKTQLARAIFKRPPGYPSSQDHDKTILIVNANTDWNGWTRAAKTITFHRVSIRPASQEELGSGEVEAGVRANILQEYLTAADTQQAIADVQQSLTASIGQVSATVDSHSTAIADLNGNASAIVGFAVQAGNAVSLLDLIAGDGSAGSYSIAKIEAQQILLKGSVSMDMLTIMDLSGNMVPDAAMVSASSWDVENSSDWTMISPQSFNWVKGESAGEIRTTRTGSYQAKNSLPFSVKEGESYAFKGLIRSIGSGNPSAQITVGWLDNNETLLSQDVIVGLGESGFSEDEGVFAAPEDARKAMIRLRVFDSNQATIGFSSVSCVRQRSGVTLLTPDSITTPLVATDAIIARHVRAGEIEADHVNTNSFRSAGLAVFGGDLRSENYNASNGTGWRITQSGNMYMPHASVGTLEIAGRAITAPRIARRSSDYTTPANGNWHTILSFTFTPASSNSDLLIIALVNGMSERWARINGQEYRPISQMRVTWRGSGLGLYDPKEKRTHIDVLTNVGGSSGTLALQVRNNGDTSAPGGVDIDFSLRDGVDFFCWEMKR